jgi:hypothetical protein
MPTTIRLHSDIEGQDYRRFLGCACVSFRSFSLVWRGGACYSRLRHTLAKDLKPYELGRRRTSCWPGTQILGGSGEGELVITYALSKASATVLLRAGSLFGWLHPDYPEDTAFYGDDSLCGFASVSHESTAWCLDPDFAVALPAGCKSVRDEMPKNVYDTYRRFQFAG